MKTNFDITRLTDLAGQDFNNPKCRVRSPHITARESIEIGDYIVAQQERIAKLEKERDAWKSYNAKLLTELKYYISEDEVEVRDLRQQAKGIQ